MIAHYEKDLKAIIIQQMKYPFEYVIARTGRYMMSSYSFFELSQCHHSSMHEPFSRYLKRCDYKISNTESGAYVIHGSIVPPIVETTKAVIKAPVVLIKNKNGGHKRRPLLYKGEERMFMDLIREKNFTHKDEMTIRARIKRGWDIERSIDEPIQDHWAKCE